MKSVSKENKSQLKEFQVMKMENFEQQIVLNYNPVYKEVYESILA